MTIHIETASRAELIAHIDRLEAKLDSYGDVEREQAMANIAAACRISPKMAKIAALLADGLPHSKSAILDHLYFDRPDDPPEQKIIDVYICKLRTALAPFGVTIETVWGLGYRILDGRDALTAIMSGEFPEVVAVERRGALVTGKRHRCEAQWEDQVLKALRDRQRQAGEGIAFTVVSRSLAVAARIAHPLSGLIRSLEAKGHLVVVSPGRQGFGHWTLRVTEKGMREPTE